MKRHKKIRKAFPQIRFAANAVSYRIPLLVTEVVESGFPKSCFPVCPRCSRSMEREYMAFCDCCGQRLSWHLLQWKNVVDWDEDELLAISK